MAFWDVIALSATLLIAIQWIPEIVKAWKTRKLNDLSWLLTFFGLSGAILFFAYGLHLQDPYIIAVNAFVALCIGTLMVMKKMFERK